MTEPLAEFTEEYITLLEDSPIVILGGAGVGSPSGVSIRVSVCVHGSDIITGMGSWNYVKLAQRLSGACYVSMCKDWF